MRHLLPDWVLLETGFAARKRIGIEGGDIVTIDDGTDGERVAGALLPGMTDLHSHAFQRTMAGLAEHAAGPDDFWSWRRIMYAHAEWMTPALMRATGAYLGMLLLEGGYTGLVEFHYLHHDAQGKPYARRTEMAEALIEGAAEAGIALTLLFGVYETAGFGAGAIEFAQRQFFNRADEALAMLEAARGRGTGDLRFGLAPHSLRAVPAASLARVAEGAAAIDPRVPIHIHVSEQIAEVADCVRDRGAPPMAWLLDHAPVDRHWCLIHGTHSSVEEKRRVAASGAVIGLCPTTEANLGDGIFDFPALTDAGGVFGIGSDSNVCTDAFTELRTLEYSQRLALRRRNIGIGGTGHTGVALWQEAARGGAQAGGREAGRIAVGARADFVVIEPAPEMAWRRASDDPAYWLDAAIFAAPHSPAKHAMVAGEWRVRDYRHLRHEAIRDAYDNALARAG